MRSGAPTTSTAPPPPSRTSTTTGRRKPSTSTRTTTARASNSMARTLYAITFAKGQTPPVKGFWSLTLYNAEHFFHANPLKRYSLGTKNKNLKLQRGRFTDAVCRRQIARQGQGKQLAARARRDVLALYPRLLAGEGHPRRHVEAADRREGEVNKPIAAPKGHDDENHSTRASWPPHSGAGIQPRQRQWRRLNRTTTNWPTCRSRRAMSPRTMCRHCSTNCSSSAPCRPTSGRCPRSTCMA